MGNLDIHAERQPEVGKTLPAKTQPVVQRVQLPRKRVLARLVGVEIIKPLVAPTCRVASALRGPPRGAALRGLLRGTALRSLPRGETLRGHNSRTNPFKPR